jgi:hypothetical protein
MSQPAAYMGTLCKEVHQWELASSVLARLQANDNGLAPHTASSKYALNSRAASHHNCNMFENTRVQGIPSPSLNVCRQTVIAWLCYTAS